MAPKTAAYLAAAHRPISEKPNGRNMAKTKMTITAVIKPFLMITLLSSIWG